MEVVNNKIVEATEDELFSVYLKQGIDDIYSFPDYINRMIAIGVNVTKE